MYVGFVGVRGTNFARPEPVFSGKHKTKPPKRTQEQPAFQTTGDSDAYFRIAQSIQRKYQSDSAITTHAKDYPDDETVSSVDEILGLRSIAKAHTNSSDSLDSDNESEDEAESDDGLASTGIAGTMANKEEDAVSEGSEPEVEATPDGEGKVEESSDAQIAEASGDSEKPQVAKKKFKKKKKRTSKTIAKKAGEALAELQEAKEEDEGENIVLHGFVGLVVIAIFVACIAIALELTGITSYGFAESLGLVEPKQSSFRKVLSNIIRI